MGLEIFGEKGEIIERLDNLEENFSTHQNDGETDKKHLTDTEKTNISGLDQSVNTTSNVSFNRLIVKENDIIISGAITESSENEDSYFSVKRLSSKQAITSVQEKTNITYVVDVLVDLWTVVGHTLSPGSFLQVTDTDDNDGYYLVVSVGTNIFTTLRTFNSAVSQSAGGFIAKDLGAQIKWNNSSGRWVFQTRDGTSLPIEVSTLITTDFIVSGTISGDSISTDSTFANASHGKLASQLSIREYVESVIKDLNWQDEVISMSVYTPPPSPDAGDRYIIPAGAIGEWSGHDNEITTRNVENTAWEYLEPTRGMALWVVSVSKTYIWNGSAWIAFGGTIHLTSTRVDDLDAGQLVRVNEAGSQVETFFEDRLNTSSGLADLKRVVSQDGAPIWAIDSSADNNYAISLSPPITSYQAGMQFNFKANTSNTGISTLNVNNLGSIEIIKEGGSSLNAGDILENQVITVIFDGTYFHMISGVGSKAVTFSIDPTETDDINQGYQIGSTWINTTNDRVWMCVDTTALNAVWKLVGLEYDYVITTQIQFEKLFGSSWQDSDADFWDSGLSAMKIPEGTSILIKPLTGPVGSSWATGYGDDGTNTFNGKSAYILRNTIYIGSFVTMHGLSEGECLVIKNDNDVTNRDSIKFCSDRIAGEDNNITSWSGSIFTMDSQALAEAFIPGMLVHNSKDNAFYYVISQSTVYVTVNKTITGVSGNATLSALITGVNFEGWTFDGRGNVDGLGGSTVGVGYNGGAFDIPYLSDSILNLKIVNHQVDGFGGALFGNNKSFNITAKNIYNCYSGAGGGGIANFYYSIFNIYSCHTGAYGGGAYDSDFAKLYLEKCDAVSGGGAYACQSSHIEAYLCTASNEGGGAILCNFSYIYARSCSAVNGGGTSTCSSARIVTVGCLASNFGGGSYGGVGAYIIDFGSNASVAGHIAHTISGALSIVGTTGGTIVNCSTVGVYLPPPINHSTLQNIGEVDPTSSDTTRDKHVANNDLLELDRKSFIRALIF